MRQMVKFNTVPDFGSDDDDDEIGIHLELCVAYHSHRHRYIRLGKKATWTFCGDLRSLQAFLCDAVIGPRIPMVITVWK